MSKRLILQDRLEEIHGVRKVYFQPPPSGRMEYPCIRYSLAAEWNKHADNMKYVGKDRYSIMIISSDPDTPIVDEVRKLPYCSLDRMYTADNLYHFVFTLYF